MKHYDELNISRHEQLIIGIVCDVGVQKTDDDKNIFIFKCRENEHHERDWEKVFVTINTDDRQVTFSPGRYKKVEFIYPEGTTHFIYKEFENDNYSMDTPIPIKIENNLLYKRQDGKWVESTKRGKRIFYIDKIKSIDEMVVDMHNPKLREQHIFYKFMDIYANDNQKYDHLNFNYSNRGLTYVTDLIYHLLMQESKDVMPIFEQHLSYEIFLEKIKDIPYGNIISVNIPFDGNFKIAYDYLLSLYK